MPTKPTEPVAQTETDTASSGRDALSATGEGAKTAEAAAVRRYIVVTPIQHGTDEKDQWLYPPGDAITLDARAAKPLLAVGAITRETGESA